MAAKKRNTPTSPSLVPQSQSPSSTPLPVPTFDRSVLEDFHTRLSQEATSLTALFELIRSSGDDPAPIIVLLEPLVLRINAISDDMRRRLAQKTEEL